MTVIELFLTMGKTGNKQYHHIHAHILGGRGMSWPPDDPEMAGSNPQQKAEILLSYLTASLSSFPGRKTGTFRAGI